MSKVETERWKPVIGYDGCYEVSDLGRVRSVDRVIHFADGRKRFYRSRLCNFKDHEFGYPLVSLSRKSVTDWRLVHQLVAAAFIGPRGEQEVCHNNGKVKDARLVNLRYDTRKGNAADMVLHGTRSAGATHYAAKYSDDVIASVRAATGIITDIAAAHRMSRTHAWNIRNAKRRSTS